MVGRINYPSITRRKINVSSFKSGMKLNESEEISSISTAKFITNFDYSKGVLKNGVGSSAFNSFDFSNLVGLKILGIYPYVRFNHETALYEERIVIYASDKCLYSADVKGGTFIKISPQTFESKPVAIEYNYLDNDVLLLSSTNGLFYLDDYTITKVEGAPDITSLCIHNERLFATTRGEGKSLWFSDDFNPTNWSISLDEAGFIDYFDNSGKLLKAVSFLDYVYVFREYGVSRVSANGSQEDFSSVNLFQKQGKIVGSSVTECGDFIVLLTSVGIYTFNGYSTSKILSELDEFLVGVNNDNAKGIFSGNTFYLKLKLKVDGEEIDALLSYDIYKKSYQISTGLDILDIVFFGSSVNSVIYVPNSELNLLKLDDSGSYNGVGLVKKWVSIKSNLGIQSRLKTIVKVSLFTNENVTLKIFADENVVVYDIKGIGNNYVFPMIKGEEFKIEISTAEKTCKIYNLTLYVDYIKEIYDE